MRLITHRIRIRKMLRTAALVAVFSYFSFHLVSGNKGVLALIQMEQRVEQARIERFAIAKEREQISRRVQMLYAHSLDRDMLDEQARKLLGYAAPDEVVIYRSAMRPSLRSSNP